MTSPTCYPGSSVCRRRTVLRRCPSRRIGKLKTSLVGQSPPPAGCGNGWVCHVDDHVPCRHGNSLTCHHRGRKRIRPDRPLSGRGGNRHCLHCCRLGLVHGPDHQRALASFSGPARFLRCVCGNALCRVCSGDDPHIPADRNHARVRDFLCIGHCRSLPRLRLAIGPGGAACSFRLIPGRSS